MSNSSPTLTRIARGNYCAGCGLCATISAGAIDMQISSDGFLRPVEQGTVSVTTDQLIADVCPGIHMDLNSDQKVNHVLWGPLVEVRTGATTNVELNHHASSGGVLSAILLYLLESKVVDYVVQIEASSEFPIENVITLSTSYEGVYAAAGSRYAPSAPLKDLDLYLERPGRFALVGKPCDIAGVRALGRHDPRVAEKIPVLLSFFCAGVPSLEGTRQILKQLDVVEEEVAAFRYRGDGWPGYARATLKDGREARMDYASSWGNILSKHVQFRCKICPDGVGSFADIVCADAWHCDEAGYPLFEDEEGRSLIVSRTTHGEAVLQQALEAGYLTASLQDIAEVQHMQPGQTRRKKLVLSRLSAIAALGRKPPQFSGFQLRRAARTTGIWPNLKSFLGMMRRLVQNGPG